MDKQIHEPVLLKEVLDLLELQSGQNGIDCTLGGGGHALEFLKKTSPQGRLLGIDRDEKAVKRAKKNLDLYKDRIIVVRANYAALKKIIQEYKFNNVDYIFCDLGLSSYQLADQGRGFSFFENGPLDMRFDLKSDLTADEILQTWSKDKLAKIFRDYGEEKLAFQIARRIVEKRKENHIDGELLNKICRSVYRRFFHSSSKVNPSTKVWQALRIAVNRELDNLKDFLPQAIDILSPGGKLAVITFHSLEDRLVKNFFKEASRDCVCPPEFPVCRCQHRASIKLVNRKVVKPSLEELQFNPRARSAKLRVVEKL